MRYFSTISSNDSVFETGVIYLQGEPIETPFLNLELQFTVEIINKYCSEKFLEWYRSLAVVELNTKPLKSGQEIAIMKATFTDDK